MKILIWSLIIIVPLSACAPAAVDRTAYDNSFTTKPVVTTLPQLAEFPTAIELSQYYPKSAVAQHIGGTATLKCDVTELGALANCVVISESPGNFGFGQSAFNSAYLFKINPAKIDRNPIPFKEYMMKVSFYNNQH